jgi:hypothetical protein
VAEPQHEYLQFGVALSLLSVLPPVEAVELLTRRLASLKAAAEEIRDTIRTATAGGVGWVFLIEEEYRLAVLDAESAFVARLMQSLEQPEYIREWHESFGRLP